jgi:hypothetical protein
LVKGVLFSVRALSLPGCNLRLVATSGSERGHDLCDGLDIKFVQAGMADDGVAWSTA